MRRLLIAASVVAIAMWGVTAHAAGKKNNRLGTEGTLKVVVATDQNFDGAPNYGDRITFEVNTTQTWNQLNVVCTQNGEPVYGTVWPFTSTPILSSQAWAGGAADCVATLIAFSGDRTTTIGAMTFTVNP
jgi:hypothetical protein